ncbi:transglutaminase-like domain-containing protein [Bacillus chungangensis]|uniref:Transglutaminase-like putative cysteine protease n=1 Tax=Bacillus chungangensis TaxID=587633 RepID=A0ABT9WV34_9BACI|nr:transglutaminase-like domain-containing protein [Bacillus chungangensis]MDQ0176973.1 transglutaminase-like putative cysteine protease [Bacillus chungangensis]
MIVCVLLLSSCSSSLATKNEHQETTKQEQKEKQKIDKYKKLVEETNAALDLKPLELTSYSEQVGATLSSPKYKKFAANKSITITGNIEHFEQLKGSYVWIKIDTQETGPAGNTLEYYTQIKDGRFKQKIRFFNGEGEYTVKVLLPSNDKENYYYDIANFEVVNVNPKNHRDITYSPFAQDASMVIQHPKVGYFQETETFSLKGKMNEQIQQQEVMLEIRKDSDSWKHVIPVKNGTFSYDIPLFYGKGIHQLTVYVPDQNRDNYFQEGTIIFIDNQSDQIMEPIEYYSEYDERGINLEFPKFGGDKTSLTYSIKGKIDKQAPFAKETTHLYITTKKDGEEALDVIPVNDFNFDDEFYLRFGPGKYDVIVSVPEIIEENSSKFRFFGVAAFSVENTDSEDRRDLLPSRGVQSEAPEIIALANELTKDKQTEREKAKAIYEYTAKNIAYNVTKYKNDEFSWDDSALKTLELKSGVCQDYAYLAIALLRASEMEARYVAGYAGTGFNRDRHAWVETKVDGEWLIMDPTWGAGYTDGDVFVAYYSEKYFDPNPAEFNKTHSRSDVEY